MTEAFIQDPLRVERQLREKAPTVTREAAPGSAPARRRTPRGRAKPAARPARAAAPRTRIAARKAK
jgi:hypothetical protein